MNGQRRKALRELALSVAENAGIEVKKETSYRIQEHIRIFEAKDGKPYTEVRLQAHLAQNCERNLVQRIKRAHTKFVKGLLTEADLMEETHAT